jgi:hypothetical protein
MRARSFIVSAIVSSSLAASLASLAGCAAQAGDVPSAAGSAESTAGASQGLTLTPILLLDEPTARIDVALPVFGCVIVSSADQSIVAELKAAFAPYFPAADVRSQCGNDNVQHYGVWTNAPTSAGDASMRDSALQLASSILQSGENFAANFDASFIQAAAKSVWNSTPKVMDGASFSTWDEQVSQVDLESDALTIGANAVTLNVSAEVYASVWGSPYFWSAHTLTATDSFLLMPRVDVPASCTALALKIQCTQSGDSLPEVGCPFTDQLPLQVLKPLGTTKYVFNYDRGGSDANGITGGAKFVECPRVPTVSVWGNPQTVTVDLVTTSTNVAYTMSTTDMRAPLSVTWTLGGKTVAHTNVQSTTDGAGFVVAVPASVRSLPYNVAETVKVTVVDADGQVATGTGVVDLSLDIAERDVCRNKPYLPQCN